MEFKICRVCLDRSATISLFDNEDDVPFCAKIMRCVNVVIEEGDGLPDALCEGCAGDVAVSYEFTQRCEASDKALRCPDMLQTDATRDINQESDIKQESSLIHEQSDHFTDNGLTEEHHADDTSSDEKYIDIKTEEQSTKSMSSQEHPAAILVLLKIRSKKCPLCEKVFAHSTSLARHKRRHTGICNYICKTCGKSFYDRSQLKRHQLVHTTEKNYTCDLCKKSMKSKDTLKDHIKLHDKKNLFVCRTCGQTFASMSNMRLHSERSGTCNICNKDFCDIQLHMCGKMPFICKICNKGCKSQRSLMFHTRFKHTNKEKFRCNIEDCEEKFPLESMLEYHVMKLHSQTTPYVCPHCARGFFRTSDLTKHLKFNHLDVQTPVKKQTH